MRYQDKIELLFDLYKENMSEENLTKLFTQCHKVLIRFLMAKGMRFDDAEDLLQDFFINEFDKSLKTYKKDTNRTFIAYIRHIIFLRYLSFYDVMRYKKIYSLDYPKEKETQSYLSTQDEAIKNIMIKEITSFFRKIITNIKNENHRNAFILKLCLPISISAEEASRIMNCTISTYTTWLYRATLSIKKEIKQAKNNGLIKFNFEDIEPLLEQKPFSFDKNLVNKITDYKYRKILISYFFDKKNIASIAKELSIKEDETWDLFKRAMFELLGFLNKKDILLRRGKLIMLEQNDVIEFIESLDKQNEGYTRKRNSITTGDKDLDRSLRIIHSIFKKRNKNIKEPLSTKEIFLNILKDKKLSLKEVAAKLNLSAKNIQKLMQEDLSDIDLRRKIHSFIENFGENTLNNKEQYNEDNFNKANKKLLDKYYKKKKITTLNKTKETYKCTE